MSQFIGFGMTNVFPNFFFVNMNKLINIGIRFSHHFLRCNLPGSAYKSISAAERYVVALVLVSAGSSPPLDSRLSG